MSDPSEIYTLDWYKKDFADLQPEFSDAARILYDIFSPRHVLDVGCGPGMLVRAFRDHGVTAVGFDGSRHAMTYADPKVRPYITQINILKEGLKLTPAFFGLTADAFDLVVCTEVLEHIAPEHAETVVKLLCSSKANSLVVTAAPPGQEGHHHVNCQPREYWHKLFYLHGYSPDSHVTRYVYAGWGEKLKRLSHMTQSVTVYR